MTKRLLPLLLLASCGAPDRAQGPAIECALDGAAGFERNCTVEQLGSGLILHHPGGGFRRLRVTSGGLAAADGADPASVSALPDGRIEVTIAGDRYRLPPGVASL